MKLESLKSESEETKETESISKNICSKCKKIIHPGEPYSKSIISGKINCSECDEGLFVDGINFFTIE